MDWRGLMHAGLNQLHLKPAEFWALTPVELQMMLGVHGGVAPMVRRQLDALLRDFPDMTKDRHDG